jgi:hypothetical protein
MKTATKEELMQILDIARRMRIEQKAYFQTRKMVHFNESTRLEKLFDLRLSKIEFPEDIEPLKLF